MSLILSLIAVLASAMLFAWLGVRAARLRRPSLKWLGTLVSALFTVVGVSMAVLGILGVTKLRVSHARPVPTLEAAHTPEQLSRGERLAYLCVGCHSSTGDLPLDGGRENFAEGIGAVYAPNLTPAGPLKGWSDGEIVRALRQGVDRDGRALSIMPSEDYRHLSDVDAAALVAYLRTQPPVTRGLPEKQMNLIGAVLVGLGVYPSSLQEPLIAPVTSPLQAATPEYGRYLVDVAGCATCHGEALTGGTPNPFVPAGPNLPVSVAPWSEEDFIRTMRSGVTPSGRVLDPRQMPWEDLAKAFEDEELEAIHAYLKSLSVDLEIPNGEPSATTSQPGEGGQLYAANCAGCHGGDGEGSVGPALAGNGRLEDSAFIIKRLLNGNGQMPAWDGILSNDQIAAVGSFIRVSFGNTFDPITANDVARQK